MAATAAPSAARRARPGAAARSSDRRPCARVAEELVGAMLELYGEGLERIFDASSGAEVRDAARRGRGRRQPAADPRPVPGRRSRSGSRRRWTACGRTWSRTAATSSCSASRTASRGCACTGSCNGCAASASTLELAIKEALEEAAPDSRARGRGRRASARRAGARRAARRADAAWVDAAGRGGARPRGELTRDGRGARRRQRRRHAAGLPRRLRGLRRAAARRPSSTAARCACAACERSFDLPRAGRARTATACSSSPCRCCAREAGRGGASRERSAGAGAGSRRLRASRAHAPAAAASAASCARSAIPTDHRHLLHLERAADRLRLRDVLGAALGRRRVPARRRAHALARRTSTLPGRAVGGVPDPDRPGVPSCARASRGGIVALYPSPAGATECELDLGAWDAARRREPRARAARARRRGADRQPARRRRRSTRSRRSTSATGSSGSIKERWEGISGGARRRGRGRRVLRRRCAAGDARRERGASAQPRPALPSRCSRCSASSRSRTRRADAALRTLRVDRADGPRGLHDRALDADPHRPGAARLRRRDARAPRRALRRARALGGDDAQLPLGARRRARARLHRRDVVRRSTCPCTYDLEVAATQVPLLAARRRGPARRSTSPA